MNYKKYAGAATIAFSLAAAAGQTYAKDNDHDLEGMATWYGAEVGKKQKDGSIKYNRTASGEKFDPNKVTAAHLTLPIPSCVKVSAPNYGTELFVRVNDRGPAAWTGNTIDLSHKAAEELGFVDAGKTHVQIEPVAMQNCPK